MDERTLLNITLRQLSARVGIEDAINKGYKGAISSSNIDGRVIDECYENFGSELSYYAIRLLKSFFESIEDKNTFLIAVLKKDINTMTDTFVSQSDKMGIEQIEAMLKKVAQDIIMHAKDRRIYGNMDHFISTNFEHYVYTNKIAFLDRNRVANFVTSIQRIAQNFLDKLLEENEVRISEVVDSFIGDLLAMINNTLNASEEAVNMETPTSLSSVEQSAAEFFAEDEEEPQPKLPSV